MSYTLRKQLYKWVCFFAIMFITIVLETTVLSEFRVFGASPMLLPFIVATISLHEGPGEGAIAGLVSGILLDALYSGYEGFYTVALPVLAVIICLMNTVMYWKNFGMAVLDWVVMIILLHFVHYCIYMLAAGKGSIASLLYVIPGEFVSSLPIAPLAYLIVSKTIKRFEVMEED